MLKLHLEKVQTNLFILGGKLSCFRKGNLGIHPADFFSKLRVLSSVTIPQGFI